MKQILSIVLLLSAFLSGCSLFKPAVFDTVDLTFNNRTGLRFTGTLYTPKASPPYPLIVIAHGSGDFKRGFTFYAVYGEYFAAHGIATFVFDKRGVGDSEGTYSTEAVYFDSLADDLASAYRFISTHPSVIKSQSGILGISQAAWVIPQAMRQIDTIAFVVAVSAPPVSPNYSDSYQLGNRLREEGYAESDIENIVEYNRTISRYVGTFQGRDRALELKRRFKDETWFKKLGYNPELSPEDTLRQPQFDHYRRAQFDPEPFWNKPSVSTLVVFGANDAHIPVDTSAKRYDQIFRRKKFTDFEIKTFANAGHLIQQVDERLEPVEPSILTMVLKGVPSPKEEYLQFVEEWIKGRINSR
jgi:hypothetical protein